jgi:hypothetical protein
MNPLGWVFNPNRGKALNDGLKGNYGALVEGVTGIDFSVNPFSGQDYNVSRPVANVAPTGSTTKPKEIFSELSQPPIAESWNNTGTGGAYGGGGGSAPAIDYNAVGQYDQSIGMLDDALNRLGVQLGIAQGNINSTYGTRSNELNTAKTNNEGNYKNSSTENQQSLRTNRNAILDQQSAGLRGLLRQLGAFGAVGSDMQVAGGAVADVASQQNAGAGQTFATNQRGLDTNWNNYLGEWANSKKRLDDWKGEQIRSAEQQSLSQRQSLLTQKADLSGQRSAAMGGKYAGGAEAGLNQARALSGQIDNLGRINPTYDGTAPQYTAPELSSYTQPGAAPQSSMGPANSSLSANPSLARLLGLTPQDDKKKGLL